MDIYESCCRSRDSIFPEIVRNIGYKFMKGIMAPLGTGIIPKELPSVLMPIVGLFVIDSKLVGVVLNDGTMERCEPTIDMSDGLISLDPCVVKFATSDDQDSFVSQGLPNLPVMSLIDRNRLSQIVLQSSTYIIARKYTLLYRTEYVYPILNKLWARKSLMDIVISIEDTYDDVKKSVSLDRLING